jgi:hypothetical protein
MTALPFCARVRETAYSSRIACSLLRGKFKLDPKAERASFPDKMYPPKTYQEERVLP